MTEESFVTKHFQSTKTYTNLPCAHRQWRAAEVGSNCAMVHGYSRAYTFVFSAHTLDRCGFVVDYGDLKPLKLWLEYMFDHTLLLCHDDPLLPQFREIEKAGGANIRLMPNGVGMESSAEFIVNTVDPWIRARTGGRCWIDLVEAKENDKNSAYYYNPHRGFNGFTDMDRNATIAIWASTE